MRWLEQTLQPRSSMGLLWSGEVQATPSLQDAITYRVPYNKSYFSYQMRNVRIQLL